jgi:hypothetical protein
MAAPAAPIIVMTSRRVTTRLLSTSASLASPRLTLSQELRRRRLLFGSQQREDVGAEPFLGLLDEKADLFLLGLREIELWKRQPAAAAESGPTGAPACAASRLGRLRICARAKQCHRKGGCDSDSSKTIHGFLREINVSYVSLDGTTVAHLWRRCETSNHIRVTLSSQLKV